MTDHIQSALDALRCTPPRVTTAIHFLEEALGYQDYECERGHEFRGQGEDPECPKCHLEDDHDV